MLTRVARTAPATLSHVFELGEMVADSSTTVGVEVLDANGDAVTSGAATSAGADTGRYNYPLPGQPDLSFLTVTWTATIAAESVVETDYCEIVGGFLFRLAQARASDTSLTSPGDYSTAQLELARLETEVECEEICNRAFVPRYRRVVLNGTGTRDITLLDADLRTIRAVRMSPGPGQDFADFTSDDLAAVKLVGDRELRRTNWRDWAFGTGNVIIEYEYGFDRPPDDLRRAALVRMRTRLNIHRSGIPDRATSFTVAEGGVFRLDMPGPYKTGLPEVDAVYGRYSLRSGAGGRPVPASRSLNFDPQFPSLFHGGTR